MTSSRRVSILSSEPPPPRPPPSLPRCRRVVCDSEGAAASRRRQVARRRDLAGGRAGGRWLRFGAAPPLPGDLGFTAPLGARPSTAGAPWGEGSGSHAGSPPSPGAGRRGYASSRWPVPIHEGHKPSLAAPVSVPRSARTRRPGEAVAVGARGLHRGGGRHVGGAVRGV